MPAAKKPAAAPKPAAGGLIPVSRGLRATSITGTGKGESFLSALVTAAGGIGGVVVPLSRPAGDDLWWSIIPGGIATLVAMQSSGEIQHFAEGWLGGTAGYLAARALQRITFPTAAQYAQAAAVQAAPVHAALGIA